MSNRVSEIKRERKIALIPLFSGRLVTPHTRPSLVPGRLRYTPSCESSVWELLRGAAGLFFQLAACDSCLYCALLSLCVCVCEEVTNGAYSLTFLPGQRVRSAAMTPFFLLLSSSSVFPW